MKVKKCIIAMLALVIVMISSSITALAGDIPESLLHDDTAQIFFGEVLSYHPNKKTPSMSVSPVVAIKGNVKEGTKQNYNNPNAMGGFNIVVGKVYLFTYYENADYIDVFEVTTYDTRTLKLKHVEGSMWERFEQYINQGKYGEAKVEGVLPYTVDILYGSIGAVICIGVVGSVIIYKKKKRMTKGVWLYEKGIINRISACILVRIDRM